MKQQIFRLLIINLAALSLLACSGGSGNGNSNKIETTILNGINDEHKQYGALVSISETSKSAHKIAITGNGKESRIRKITLNNNSDVAANLIHNLVDNKHRLLLLSEKSSCGAILAAKTSCELRIQLANTITDQAISNNAFYQLRYSAVSTGSEVKQINYALDYTIYPKNLNFVLKLSNNQLPTISNYNLNPNSLNFT